MTTPEPQQAEIRVDKWLWAARFFKTRSLAQTALENGRVLVDGERVKRSRTIQIGQKVWLRTGHIERTVVVLGVSANRGSAPVAQTLYEETEESVANRQAQRDKRRLFVDPASAIAAGRPTKRDRRRIHELQGGAADDLD
ncbi:MAG: RNA-binding S4 domain-containing protein [Burkholderiaceae bacterium]